MLMWPLLSGCAGCGLWLCGRAPAEDAGEAKAAAVSSAGEGHPPGDPGVGHAAPGIGDAHGTARAVVAERLMAAEPEAVVRLLEHDAVPGGAAQDQVVADGLDLGDLGDSLR